MEKIRLLHKTNVHIHIEILGPVRTYLTRVVRMLYVRLSSLSSVMVQVPGSRAVWTSSFNAVKRVPSCSVTAFSNGSCWPAVWVASPTRQEHNITEVLLRSPPGGDASCPLSAVTVYPTEHRCEKVSYQNLICQSLFGFSFWQ